MRLVVILTATMLCVVRQAPSQSWTIAPCERIKSEPIIRPESNNLFKDPKTNQMVAWESLHTFNPAAIVRRGEVIVLYRAEDNTGDLKIGGHISRLGIARSKDGVAFLRSPKPVFYPDNDAQQDLEWPGGVEDPRVVESEDGRYFLTYTQWSRRTRKFTIGIANSTDLVHWKKHGPIFGELERYQNLSYKSSAIITRYTSGRLKAAKINGRYWMYWGEGEVHLASSDDLIHWTPVEKATGSPLVLLSKRPGKTDSGFPETGPPAVLTNEGIVLFYNARNADGDDRDTTVGAGAYAVHEALFSATDPSQLLERTEKPVLQPALAWEKSGQYRAGTTFAEGLVAFHDRWLLYYGSADSYVGVADCGSLTPASASRRDR